MNHLEKIRSILATVSQSDAGCITPQTSLVSDLEMDSFMLMDAMNMLEDTFGITIPDRDLRGFMTVGDVAAYLDAQK